MGRKTNRTKRQAVQEQAELQKAYRLTFPGDSTAAQTVLLDLAHFCKANETTFHPDARVQAHLEGRREVWLRLQKILKLTPEQYIEMIAGGL